MSPILLMILIIVAVFACVFGLAEWIAHVRGKRDTVSAPRFGLRERGGAMGEE